MNARAIEAGLWAGAIAVLAIGAVESRRIFADETVAAPMVWPAPLPNATASADSLAVLQARIVDADVFRLDRKPAMVTYRVEGDTSGTVPQPAPLPKPVLKLVGIVGGPPWAALVDGIPFHDGTVLVYAGDTVGGLRIRDISAAAVTVTGVDTVWRLSTKPD